MEEDHSNDSLAIARLRRILELRGCQGNPNGEGADHSTRSNQEQWTTAESVNHAGPEPRLKHVDHQNESVEHVLVVCAVDANVQQDVVEVVCRQTGA